MDGWRHRLARSTISMRLLLVVLIPSLGLLYYAAVSATDERDAATAARELREQAELVELLSAASVRLTIERDNINTLSQVRTLPIDPEIFLSPEFRPASNASADNQIQLWDLLGRIDRIDSDVWADGDSVNDLRRLWPILCIWFASDDMETLTSGEGNERMTSMADALESAIDAQHDQLREALDRSELDGNLSEAARVLEESLDVAAAAQAERRALSVYLLPLNDRSDEENYRGLVETAAEFDLLFGGLQQNLEGIAVDRLDALQRTESWLLYDELKQEAIDREATPPPVDENLLRMAPQGIVLFTNGIDRIESLIEFQLEISADFTRQTADRQSQAEQNLLLSILTTIGFIGITTVASIAVIGSISGPIASLLNRAVKINSGELDTVGPVTSPSDIHQVHRTLDEMSANLSTLSAQTAALSDGRLDDEVLNKKVAGPLGASVHGSLRRLRSMTARLDFEANHDALTGLPNRAALLSLLDRCLTGPEDRRKALAAIMFDLDGFKQANDDMGHPIGDEVLVHISRRLESEIDGEFAARLGGDEFMVIVVGEEALVKARAIATTVLEAIGRPIVTSAGTVSVSASVGIVAATGPEWLTATEVLRRVDLAMYQAKSDSPGLVVEFDQQLHDSLLATTQLQGEIRRAIDLEEFEIVLQPITRLPEGRIVGFESLLRWRSDLRGPVAPGLFIPVAEQSELIVHIDNWVIDRTAAMLGRWRHDPALSELTLSVNVSARHISHPDLVERVRCALETHGARPDRYVLEVTESQLIPNLSRAEDNLRELRELGLQLAIDDFGTGYASVAHLRRVRFDRLKIDQTFVTRRADETDRALAALMVSVGRDLGLEVVAEGIETMREQEWAVSVGCTHAQGYLVGRPGPLDSFLPALEAQASSVRSSDA